MNKQEYLGKIAAMFNTDPNHPGLTEIERHALNSIKNIELGVNKLTEKLLSLQKDAENVRLQILTERSKSEGIQDLLFELTQKE